MTDPTSKPAAERWLERGLFASRWLMDQLNIPAATRDAIRIKVYDGGHMMYLKPASREALAADAAALFQSP